MLAYIRVIDGRTGGLQVLLALYVSASTLKFSELCRQVRLDRGTVRRAVEALASAGIVERFEDRKFPFSKSIRLTSFGNRVATEPLINWPSLFLERGLAQDSALTPVERT